LGGRIKPKENQRDKCEIDEEKRGRGTTGHRSSTLEYTGRESVGKGGAGFHLIGKKVAKGEREVYGYQSRCRAGRERGGERDCWEKRT